jgi:Glycosyl transferase family 11
MADTSLRRLIVRCNGGLGNQIFQYAAGLYFAERAAVPLEVLRPPGPPEAYNLEKFARPFQLDHFSFEVKSRPSTWVDRFYTSPEPVFRFCRNTVRGIARTRLIEEPSSHRFLPTLLDPVRARDIYLTGFWQAAAYAEANADRLRDSLQLRNEPQQRNQNYAEAIRALKCPVSVHIRVGDYAGAYATESNSGTQVTWVLRKSYYREAITRIRTLHPEAKLVVFSDDPAGAQAMMDGEPVDLWVKGNTPASAFEELWLMSCCRHHVIANSSFSWWGAWMNPDPKKVILAPKYWFNTQDSYYPELLPASWNVIDNLG